ncbi:S8 family serine peptidase [Micromonospora sp. SL4-19]|uniref:S8 family serine peptidase n=1 Tax=Micromonospora sp. SL4-19 TaxID=3399129 RepID=UPI003A4E26DF
MLATTLSATSLLLPSPANAKGTQPGVDRVRSDQWHLQYLQIAKAHRLNLGDGVTVAVLDTGVDSHPDLVPNLLQGADAISGGTGNGQHDLIGHGTGMAGLIAARGRGGTRGALGIAPHARILPVIVTPTDGGGESDALADGIEYAISHGANIISISSVGGATQRLIKAVNAALSADVVIVASAGNRPQDAFVGYPASRDGVIAVSGVNKDGSHAAVSVTGPQVDVAAPAVDIYSTSINGTYRVGTGTSDATAIVAGAAALIRSKFPDLPAQEVAHRLTATAIDKGPPGRDDEYGYGVIDLVAALTADVPPLGFESTAATAPASTRAASAEASGDGATARGLATLGVLLAAGGGYLVWRRRRRADDPPPRISR